ncbi:MAG: glycogen debranching enzyme N-terminal domain-containing protein [Blautia sp.]|nr:glycogen debranching enzyme N-terminal domain-containing protein [Blautia sp.]
MNFHFSGEQLSELSANIRKEWVMTNGLGGYAGGSVTAAMCRTHQGYLIASLHPPVERYLLLACTRERLYAEETCYDLETSQHAGAPLSTEHVVDHASLPEEYRRTDTVNVASGFIPRRPVYAEGQRFLTAFDYDGNVTFSYQAGNLTLKKQLTLVQGENTAAIGYEVKNGGEAARLIVTPLFNYREHSASAAEESLRFEEELFTDGTAGLLLRPMANPRLQIVFRSSRGTLKARTERFDRDMQYQIEVDNETPGLDCHYTPYDLLVSIPAHSTVQFSVVCSAVTSENAADLPGITDETARSLADAKRTRLQELIDKSGYGRDAFAASLVAAADQFLAFRSSTGLMTVLAGLPWFTDWGRDTMIAFSGLTLATRRFASAREILVTFARYVRHGLVPNMFPDDGQAPLYNTVDASLWYFYATDQYLRYTGAPEDYDFVKKELFAALKEILAAYRSGTDFSIYMDTDGLIHAGSGVDQVTWMDVRVGDWVVTPRHGKPVEINALWYNALMVMAGLAEAFGEPGEDYRALAGQVKDSFLAQFWNEADGCLYDVVDGEEKDASIRPNQLYAVSLPYTMLDDAQASAVVDTAERELLAGPGIRSLSCRHKDYHGIYCGSLPKRDAAYHQGTAWGFPMGAFITAYTKVHGKNEATRRRAMEFLAPVMEHMQTEGCIGSISEIFDGDSPHTCRGCYAQAWSVGEVLRCYTEDVLR